MKDTRVTDLFNSCIYSSIAHAVVVLKEPYFSYEQSWDQNNYSFIFDGVRGTISFDIEADIAVGAARNEKSALVLLYPDKMRPDYLLISAPEAAKALANTQAFMYLYDEVNGYVGPVVTVAFWIVGKVMGTSWEDGEFNLQGGTFFEVLTSDLKRVQDYWNEQYEFDEMERALCESLYGMYLEGQRVIKLDEKLKSITKEAGYSEMLESLGEIGIQISF